MTDEDFKRIENLIARNVGVQLEGIRHQVELVAEGQQMLAERMDRMENDLRGDIGKLDTRMTRLEAKVDNLETKVNNLDVKVDTLEAKVDAIAADLTAHRADTEAHRRGYRVREE